MHVLSHRVSIKLELWKQRRKCRLLEGEIGRRWAKGRKCWLKTHVGRRTVIGYFLTGEKSNSSQVEYIEGRFIGRVH